MQIKHRLLGIPLNNGEQVYQTARSMQIIEKHMAYLELPVNEGKQKLQVEVWKPLESGCVISEHRWFSEYLQQRSGFRFYNHR
jgi:hypothetical protein